MDKTKKKIIPEHEFGGEKAEFRKGFKQLEREPEKHLKILLEF